MKKAPRAIIALLLAGTLLVLGLAYSRVVVEHIFLPAATVLWLLLRLFVLSIHQAIFWWGVVLVAAFVPLAAALRDSTTGVLSHSPVPSVCRDPVWTWRQSILANGRQDPDKDTVRRDLAWLLTSPYASARPGCAPYQVLAALQERRIALPQSIYDFLFSETRPREPAPSLLAHPVIWLRVTAESLGRAARTGLSRRGGRAASDYLASIEEVLAQIETLLEYHHEGDSPDA